MKKQIYLGKNEGLYKGEQFHNFAVRLNGAEEVPTYSGFALDSHHFIVLVSPKTDGVPFPAICLSYFSKANEARVIAIGDESSISEIERKILEEAQKR